MDEAKFPTLPYGTQSVLVEPVSKPTSTFTLFPELPYELRLMIWDHAITPRILQVQRYDIWKSGESTSSSHRPTNISANYHPLVLSINHESREYGLRHHRLCFRFSFNAALGYPLYVSKYDTLLLSNGLHNMLSFWSRGPTNLWKVRVPWHKTYSRPKQKKMYEIQSHAEYKKDLDVVKKVAIIFRPRNQSPPFKLGVINCGCDYAIKHPTLEELIIVIDIPGFSDEGQTCIATFIESMYNDMLTEGENTGKDEIRRPKLTVTDSRGFWGT